MKGIGRTVVQLIYGSGLQRWLLGIGLALTMLGTLPRITGRNETLQDLFAVTGLLGVAIAVISPIVVGVVMFRALSAARSVQLIPRGRLKLILGAFSAQLLLALFIALSISTLASGTIDTGFAAEAFVMTFSALTIFFVGFYSALNFRFGGLMWPIYILAAPVFYRASEQIHLGALLRTPIGLVTGLTVSALAWSVFAIGYIRQRHVTVPDWKLVGQGSSRTQRTSAAAKSAGAPARYERKQAVRVVLLGVANIQRHMVLFVLIISLALLTAMLITTHLNVASRTAFVQAFIICLAAGVIPAAPTGLMTRRAKSLWLTGRVGREELFVAVERQSWSMVLWVASAAMALAIPALAFSLRAMPTPAQLLGIVVLPVTAGASLIYVSLLLVRGKRFADTVLVTCYTVLLMVEMFSALAQSPTSILPPLLAANIIALPLLRHMGLRRWHDIDWLIHKRSATQFPG
jgi:hypothetical protein